MKGGKQSTKKGSSLFKYPLLNKNFIIPIMTCRSKRSRGWTVALGWPVSSIWQRLTATQQRTEKTVVTRFDATYLTQTGVNKHKSNFDICG